MILSKGLHASILLNELKRGFLFRSTEEIKKEYPELPAFETYDELMDAIKKAL